MFLIVIGHTTVTTALIEKCNKYKIPLVVMKPNFRSVYYFGNFADGNFLLRKKQHSQPQVRPDIGKLLVTNKLTNQFTLLHKTLKKDGATESAKDAIAAALTMLPQKEELKDIMTLEGRVAKKYFEKYNHSYYLKHGSRAVYTQVFYESIIERKSEIFKYIQAYYRAFMNDKGIEEYPSYHYK